MNVQMVMHILMAVYAHEDPKFEHEQLLKMKLLARDKRLFELIAKGTKDEYIHKGYCECRETLLMLDVDDTIIDLALS